MNRTDTVLYFGIAADDLSHMSRVKFLPYA
jgi:hypothetical protein